MEYMYHEHVHIYTYDLFAEKLGFKIIWGCLCFYPFFYPIGIWAILQHTGKGFVFPAKVWVHLSSVRVQIPDWAAAASVLFFVAGWILSRGANNQKHLFKTEPKKRLLGFISPKAVGSSKLLCSGWWALSRHINYLGEILMAIGLGTLAFFLAQYLTIALMHPMQQSQAECIPGCLGSILSTMWRCSSLGEDR